MQLMHLAPGNVRITTHIIVTCAYVLHHTYAELQPIRVQGLGARARTLRLHTSQAFLLLSSRQQHHVHASMFSELSSACVKGTCGTGWSTTSCVRTAAHVRPLFFLPNAMTGRVRAGQSNVR